MFTHTTKTHITKTRSPAMFRRMLTAACLVGLIGLAGTAARGEIILATGEFMEVVVSDPVPVGAAGAPDLMGFTVTIRNISAVFPTAPVTVFDSKDPGIIGAAGLTVANTKMHQELFTTAGTFTPLAGPYKFGFLPEYSAYQHPIGTPQAGIDSHFLFTAADIVDEFVLVAPGGTPFEDAVAASTEPTEFWVVPAGGDPGAQTAFGNELGGSFGDSRAGTSWDLAWVAGEVCNDFTFNAFVVMQDPAAGPKGEVLTGSFHIVPEPGMMVLLLTGAVAVLVCWRRRRSPA